MPTYQYACTECGEQSEVVQKFSDDPLTVCSACGGRLRKVFSPVGIVFKGSGFYRTDSRAAANGHKQNGSRASAETSADSKSGDSKQGESGGTSKSGDSAKSSAGTSGNGKSESSAAAKAA